MAEKTLLYKLQFSGTMQAHKNLKQLEGDLHKLTKEQKAHTKAIKDKDKLTDKEIAKTNKLKKTIQQTRTAIRQNRTEVIANVNASKKLGNSYNDLTTKNKSLYIAVKKLAEPLGKDKRKFDELTASIKKNNAALKGMDARMGNSQRNVGNYRSAIGGLTGAFGVTLGAAGLVMAMKNVIGTIKEFDQKMATVKAISGATASEFDRLKKSAKELGASTMFTASQVGQLQLEFSKLGFSTEEILNATEATLNLATATESELAESAKIAASTVRGFGLNAKDTTRVTDVMAKSFSSSALDLQKFGTAMAIVAPVAKNSNFTLEETTAVLGKVMDAGVDASSAGTALRNVFLELSKQGLTWDQAMKKIQNSTNKNKTAMELFGKRGAAVANIIATNTHQIDDLKYALDNSAGSAKAMADVVGDTLHGDMKRLSSAWEGFILGLDSGDGALSQVISGFLEMSTAILGVLTPMHRQSEALVQEKIDTEVLVTQIQLANEGTEKRTQLINELRIKYPEFLGNIKDEAVTNELLARRIKEVNEQMIAKIVLAEKEDEISEQQEDTADKLIMRENTRKRVIENLIKAKDEYGVKLLEIGTIEERVAHAQKELAKKGLFDQKAKNGNLLTYLVTQETAANLHGEFAKDLRLLTMWEGEYNEELDLTNKLTKEKNKLAKQLGLLTGDTDEDRNKKKIKEEIERAQQIQVLFKDISDEYATLNENAEKLVENPFFGKEALKRGDQAKQQLIDLQKALALVRIMNEQKLTDEVEAQKELDKLDKNRITNAKKAEQEAKRLATEKKQKQNEALKEAEADRKANLLTETQDIQNSYDGTVESYKSMQRKIIEAQLESLQIQKANYEKYGQSTLDIDRQISSMQFGIKAQDLKETEKIRLDKKAKDKKDQDEIDKLKKQANDNYLKATQDLITGVMELQNEARNRELEREIEMLQIKVHNGLISEQEFEDQSLALRKDAFQKQKKTEMAMAVINGAVAVTKTIAQLGGVGAITPAGAALIASMVATTLVQVGLIGAQKFALGGMVEGNSHAQGGEKFAVGGKVAELEGGEAVINKKSTSMFKPILSRINEIGGGKKFANGGMMQKLQTGGEIIPSKLFFQSKIQATQKKDTLKVINVVTDTTAKQQSITNIENEATI